MKTINEKITLKSITSNINLLMKSDYKLCVVTEKSYLAMSKFGIKNCNFIKGNKLQIPLNFDIISLNKDLFIHKHTNGNYFTYRVSGTANDEFAKNKFSKDAIKDGVFGVHIILKNIN